MPEKPSFLYAFRGVGRAVLGGCDGFIGVRYLCITHLIICSLLIYKCLPILDFSELTEGSRQARPDITQVILAVSVG
jgi:hypothetical protein